MMSHDSVKVKRAARIQDPIDLCSDYDVLYMHDYSAAFLQSMSIEQYWLQSRQAQSACLKK